MSGDIIISFMLYITLRQYEYIVAVADAGSLTDAAALLHVSQPSLSVAITRAEQKLGQPMFVRRKGAAIQITPFGHQVVDRARNLIRLATEIELGPEKVRPIVVGCFEDIAPWYLLSTLEMLKASFPSVSFKGQEGRFSKLAADLAEGRADIAISYDIGFEGAFERRKIIDIKPVAFLSIDHPLSTRSSIDIEDLINYPLILSTEELSEGFIRNLFDESQLTPNITHRATSLEMMRSMAAHDLGVGISYSHPPNDISYDGKPILTVPICSPKARADIVLLWSGLRKMDQQFSDVLDAVAASDFLPYSARKTGIY
ncbi:LysR family transcriptional regulator [Halocynthiibacter sp.]|uniref:LysR family transcriptional regulator n=1 Tax=Halocynthiibacter sp. TaxID=1979210 RepID=UPI003C643968